MSAEEELCCRHHARNRRGGTVPAAQLPNAIKIHSNINLTYCLNYIHIIFFFCLNTFINVNIGLEWVEVAISTAGWPIGAPVDAHS